MKTEELRQLIIDELRSWDRRFDRPETIADSILEHIAEAGVPEGAQVVLISKDDKFTSGYLLLPDGSRAELHPEAWGNP